MPHKQLRRFAFIAGWQVRQIKPQHPVNQKAAERMGRLLFCLFADDTGIFRPAQAFREGVEQRTAGGGSELGPPLAAFDAAMREHLLDACGIDWGATSPAIFGALFQSIMDAKARRNLGAHYTSEDNILELIASLFLDALWERAAG